MVKKAKKKKMEWSKERKAVMAEIRALPTIKYTSVRIRAG